MPSSRQTPLPILSALDICATPSLATVLLMRIDEIPTDDAEEAAADLARHGMTHVFQVMNVTEAGFNAFEVYPHVSIPFRAALGPRLNEPHELAGGVAVTCIEALKQPEPARWLLEKLHSIIVWPAPG